MGVSLYLLLGEPKNSVASIGARAAPLAGRCLLWLATAMQKCCAHCTTGIWAIVEAVIIAIGTKIVKASGKHPLTNCQRLKALADALAYKKGDVSVAPKIPADADDDKQKGREPTATARAPHKSEVAVRTTTSLAKLYQQLRALNAAAKAKRGGRPAPA